MTRDPRSPFNWRDDPRPSIFANDPYFRAKGPEGKTTGQIMTDFVERQRAKGIEPGTIHNLGKPTRIKEQQLLAYKQFGVYSKASPSTKLPNKHEK